MKAVVWMMLFVVVFVGMVGVVVGWNPIQNEPTGVAASGSWTDPATGRTNNYYVYTQMGGVTSRSCAATPPASVRGMVPKGHILMLASMDSPGELEAVKAIVKSQKAPYRFARETAYGVDNFYNARSKVWVTTTGQCRSYIPWGDACRGTREPNHMKGKHKEYCTSLDFRGTLVCSPGDKCSNDKKKPYDASRKCNYDGVYNNQQCKIRLTGCVYESTPAPLPPPFYNCRTDGIALCPGGTVNLVRNGDFELGLYEEGGGGSYTFQPDSFGLFGWLIERGAVVSQAANVFPPAHGAFSVRLNGAGTGSLITTYISVDATVARTYAINFAVSPVSGFTGNSPIRVTITDSNNNVLANQDINVQGGVGWQPKTVNFNSIQGHTVYTIQFQSLTGNPGPQLDAVTGCQGNVYVPPGPSQPPRPSSQPSNSASSTKQPIAPSIQGSSAPSKTNTARPSTTTTHTRNPVAPTQAPSRRPPQLQCGIGSQILHNPHFSKGNFQNGYSGNNLNFVGAGKGNYDVLNSNQGQTNIESWTVAAGPILWSTGAFPNAPSTTHTVGMLPGSSLTTAFTVPKGGIAYTLTVYVMTNPWGPANLKSASTVQTITVAVRGATYNRYAAPKGYIPVLGSQNTWTKVQYTFATRTDQVNYILDLQLDGAAFSLGGAVQYSNSQTGVLIGGLSLCQSADSVSLSVGNRCTGSDSNNYLKNSFFIPNSGNTIHGNMGVGIGNYRMYPWLVTANAIDHYFGYWQNPPGADYSVDLSGTDPLMLGAIQQTVTLDPNTVKSYTLNFDLSGNVDCGPTTKHLRIRILNGASRQPIPNGVVEYQFSTVGRSKGSMGWVNKQWSFRSVQGVSNYIVELSSLDNTNCGPVVTLAFLCHMDIVPNLRPMVCNSGRTANAVSNGDFEYMTNPFVPAPWTVVYAGSAYLTNWAVTDGTIELYGAGGWKAASGIQSIDMSGISAGTLIQYLRLPFGYSWTLSFAMAANPGTPPVTKAMQVTVYRADATNAPVVRKTFSWDSDPATMTTSNMGWVTQFLNFNTYTDTKDYVLEFKSLTPGYAGIAIDDVRVCSPLVLVYPPTGPYTGPAPSNSPIVILPPSPGASPAPKYPGTIPTTWTVTADNSFEFYVDGVEVPPTDAQAIDVQKGCAGSIKYTPYNKYCCSNAASGASARCDWTKSETFTAPVQSDRSIIAIHVTNFPVKPPSPPNDASATDPTDGGANPAALLVSYVRDGRQCGVSDISDWRCSFDVPQADVNSGVWTTADYSGDSNFKSPVSFGLNGPGSFTVFGGQAAQLYKGHSIWYSGTGQIKGIPTYAQWIWGAAHAAGNKPQMWCRTFVPNLYC